MRKLLITFAIFISSCENITPQQIQFVHDLYHDLTNESCILEVEDSK